MTRNLPAVQHEPVELSFVSGRTYEDPFGEIELDVILDGPAGSMRVPAWWAGGNEWRARLAPPRPGSYQWRTVCTDESNEDLHGRTGTLEASAYRGDHPVLVRGGLGLSRDRRSLQFADGTPLLLLGDTWWLGLTGRLDWPDGFRMLAADRAAKGFNTVLLIAGMYPEVDLQDARAANMGLQGWEPGFVRTSPAWWDLADLRVQWLVRAGLIPCIVGGWGYFLYKTPAGTLRRHWRTIIGRWGAYPVIWCLAGETSMPLYRDNVGSKAETIRRQLRAGWGELLGYVRSLDGHGRLITTHPEIMPSPSARDQVDCPELLDFDMLQTGHGGPDSLGYHLRSVAAARRAEPPMPVVLGELNYEGIANQTHQDIQRLGFYSSMLSGCCGFIYGANGIWQMNSAGKTLGANMMGLDYGGPDWTVAARLSGARQIGLAARLLRRYPWQELEPRQDLVTFAATEDDPMGVYCAAIPRRLRILYRYRPIFPWTKKRPAVLGVEPDVAYRATLIDPVTGVERDVGMVQPDSNGTWPMPVQQTTRDCLVVMAGT